MHLHLRKTTTIAGHSQNGRNMNRQNNHVKLLAMRNAKGRWDSGRRGSRSDRVASGLALCFCLTQPPQRAVVAQQLFVEGAHAAAGEGMQRSLEQLEAMGCLYPVLVAVVVQTGHQFLGHRVHSPYGPFRHR